jgi:hypothetical protein
MLLNQETLRLIFGLKLRNLRLDRNLSLKDLAKKTGLSPSYLNEIEKGKKYPKPEKIALLTETLGESYDDLISLRLNRELSLVSDLLEKGLFQQMPFEVFGIPAQVIFELIADHPKKMGVLIGSCLEVARAHNIRVEDFLYAILRAYIDMHQNYFATLEEQAVDFFTRHPKLKSSSQTVLLKELKNILSSEFSVRVVEKDLHHGPAAPAHLTYFWSEKKSTLAIDAGIDVREKIFLATRHIAYRLLNMKQQPQHDQQRNFESFEQLLDHFSGNYLAGCILVPQADLVQDLKAIFGAPQWRAESFLKLVEKYPCPPETLFHRISQLLPRFMGLENLFFLRYDFDQTRERFEVSRELHLSHLHSPHATKSDEHYCARWVTHKMTKGLMQNVLQNEGQHLVGIQRSQFYGTENEYLVLTCGFSKSNRKDDFASVSLGIALTEKTQKEVHFLKDLSIPKIVVSGTCERCPLEDCKERLAPMTPSLDPAHPERLRKLLQELELGF